MYIHLVDTSQLRYTHDNLRWLSSSLISHFSLSFSLFLHHHRRVDSVYLPEDWCTYTSIEMHTSILIIVVVVVREGWERERRVFSPFCYCYSCRLWQERLLSPPANEKIASRERSVILIDRSSPLFYLADHTWHNQIVLVSLDICISLISSRCHNESSRSTTQASRQAHVGERNILLLTASRMSGQILLLLENANCSFSSLFVFRQHALVSTSSYLSLVTQLVRISTSALTFSPLSSIADACCPPGIDVKHKRTTFDLFSSCFLH